MINFAPLQGEQGDSALSDTVLGAEASQNQKTIQVGSDTGKTGLGNLISGFIDSFLNNASARALNNQAIAQLNEEKAKRESEKSLENIVLISAMILVFVLAIAATKKK